MKNFEQYNAKNKYYEKMYTREEMEQYMRTHSPYPTGKQGDIDWKNGFERGVEWFNQNVK